MANYIGVKVLLSSIKDKQWKDIKRPCDMKDIIYMSSKFPSETTLKGLENALGNNEAILIFNPDDTLRYMGRK